MGTNYYISCKHCKKEIIHLGKQSAGHGFCSNYDIQKVKRLLHNLDTHEILTNEYAEEITKKQFWERIEIKDWRILGGEFC